MSSERVEVYDYDHDLPDTLPEFIEFFRSKLELIPEKYRDCASIDIDTSVEHGSPVLDIWIYYLRPKTEEEEREAAELKSEQERFIANVELKEYHRLKAIYEE